MMSPAVSAAVLLVATATAVVYGAELKRDVCACPASFLPVCSSARGRTKTYSNQCDADCAGATLVHDGKCELEDCRCPRNYRPVCGDDNQEYNSRCIAECLGVGVRTEGHCLQITPHNSRSTGDCMCTMEYNPVCGSDRQTYDNPCLARCSGATIVSRGDCPHVAHTSITRRDLEDALCACNDIYDPVCGSDGNDYSSPCLARCSDTTIVRRGSCSDPCLCTMEHNPVCGSDGKDYSNPCLARCSGATVKAQGSCASLRPVQLPVVSPLKRDACRCRNDYKPVCDDQGNQFNNKCLAKCAGVAESEISAPPCVVISHHDA